MERTVRARRAAGLRSRGGRSLGGARDGAHAPRANRGGAAGAPCSTKRGTSCPTLQYHLHTGAELALGFQPPPGRAGRCTRSSSDALGQARDATAQVLLAAEAYDDELVEHSLPEWRGALFRVRLARLRALERLSVPIRLEKGPAPEAAGLGAETMSSPAAAIAATCLAITGAMLFTAGAVLAAWPVWAAGLALFAGGFVLFGPRRAWREPGQGLFAAEELDRLEEARATPSSPSRRRGSGRTPRAASAPPARRVREVPARSPRARRARPAAEPRARRRATGAVPSRSSAVGLDAAEEEAGERTGTRRASRSSPGRAAPRLGSSPRLPRSRSPAGTRRAGRRTPPAGSSRR